MYISQNYRTGEEFKIRTSPELLKFGEHFLKVRYFFRVHGEFKECEVSCTGYSDYIIIAVRTQRFKFS